MPAVVPVRDAEGRQRRQKFLSLLLNLACCNIRKTVEHTGGSVYPELASVAPLRTLEGLYRAHVCKDECAFTRFIRRLWFSALITLSAQNRTVGDSYNLLNPRVRKSLVQHSCFVMEANVPPAFFLNFRDLL